MVARVVKLGALESFVSTARDFELEILERYV